MSRDIGAFVTGLIVITVIFVLVRPGSQGPKFVTAVGSSISSMLSSATGGGSFTSG